MAVKQAYRKGDKYIDKKIQLDIGIQEGSYICTVQCTQIRKIQLDIGMQEETPYGDKKDTVQLDMGMQEETPFGDKKDIAGYRNAGRR